MTRLYGPGPGEPPALAPSGDLAGLSTSDVEERPIGKIYGTLAEVDTGLIRYLDVAINDPPRHVLVPIGHARIDRGSVPPRVRLRAATHSDLLSVPEFTPDEPQIGAEYQSKLMDGHGRLFYGSRYYAHPAYDHRSGLQAVQEERADDTAEEVAAAEDHRRRGERSRLEPLSEMIGYRVAKRSVDVRGWPLEDDDSERVGEVADLLVERESLEVRYIVVQLDHPSRQTALPIGYVEIDTARGCVYTPVLEVEDIRVLPPYEAPLTREDENRILAGLEGRLTGDRYFSRPDFRAP